MNYAEAIRSRIVGDTDVQGLADTYEGGVAAFMRIKPADYVWKPAPGIIVRRPTDLGDISAFRGRMSNLALTIVVYGLLEENSTDDTPVHNLAMRIRELFRGKSFVGADGIRYQALVSGPIAAPTDDVQMVGELLQLRVNVGD